MPQRRKRQHSDSNMEENKYKRSRTSNSSRSSKTKETSAFSHKKCLTLFHEYKEKNEDVLGPEGMEKFCEDIGVEPENIVMLSLAYKLDAKQMGFFTHAEWVKGMTDIQCDSIRKIQDKLDYLKSLLEDPVIFKNIYRFAFDFARNKDQRSMDIETAQAMSGLILGKKWSLFPQFNQFLEQSRYKVINKDQWCNVLEFSRTIKQDLSNYDEDGAWPVILDEFVEWLKTRSTTV